MSADVFWDENDLYTSFEKDYFMNSLNSQSDCRHVLRLSTCSFDLYDMVTKQGKLHPENSSAEVAGRLALIGESGLSEKITPVKHATNTEVMTVNEADLVIGISLSEELRNSKTETKKWNFVLGVIILEKLDLNAEELRRNMCSQLPTLPATFTFLTKEGWPVLKQQERLIKANHLLDLNNIITIKKQFEKHRIGIITSTGDCLGFIFVDFSSNLSQVREALNNQIINETSVIKWEYRFVERNGWPVLILQENLLNLMDILIGHYICIQYDDKFSLTSSVHETHVQTNLDGCSKKKPSKSNPKTNPPPEKKKLGAKTILISYVRAEATEFALQLKSELCSLGFSVYLDVHEIRTGSDWQDALNDAVRNCYMFLPLITPMYGKTQWTNREVKLADALGKLIIPVNFQEHWPPECLAIQFASTQYIPYKLVDAGRGDAEKVPMPNTRIWEIEYVKNVSKEISLHFRRDQEHKLSTRKSPFEPTESKPGESVTRSELLSVKRKLIVISVHPKQKALARQLKTIFTKDGYEVWCSVDIPESQSKNTADSESYPLTPRELPTIQEGEVFFSQVNGESSVSFVESKYRSSIYRQETYITDHRPISRLLSQNSDISQVYTLTPDKLERLKIFQQKTDQAGVVIIVESEAYTKSKTSQQQVFYCEHRKQVVLVKCDHNQVPAWFTRLMGNDMITYGNNTQFESTLKARVKRALNPASSETPKDATAEAKLQCLVNFMKKNLTQIDECVYVAGSSKLQNPRSAEICRAVAEELSKVKNISIVTGGFMGSADILAKTFYDIKMKNTSSCLPHSPVVHILPMRDSQDFSSKAQQQPDGSFETASYGKTMFLGDSVKERESAVARLFDTCVLIEGGPGTAREVEEFIWNDHFVIPIISTGGAAGGQYGVPFKIFEIPPNVSTEDWSVLAEKDATPEDVAKAVKNIVVALKNSMASHSQRQDNNTSSQPRKSKRKLKSQKGKYDDNKNAKLFPESSSVFSEPATDLSWESSSDEFSRIVEPRRVKWWQRIFYFFSNKRV